MMTRLVTTLSACVVAITAAASEDGVSPADVRSAIRKAIPLLEAGSAGSADQRKCFTCHNQALPIVALCEARRRGFKVDENNLKRQIKHTEEHLKRGRKNYLEGRGQGGRVITAGYALWALEAGEFASDDTTSSVTSYLLRYQSDKNRWSHPGQRPPSSGSDFTTTYVALRSLAVYGTDEQSEAIQERIAKVRPWLVETEPVDMEDRVFRLRSLGYLDTDPESLKQAVTGIIDAQQDDGGWAQTSKLTSDAYATATVLVALLRETDLSPADQAIRRGVNYLLENQKDDGSWHVTTRARPFQTYYESGFPHGKDQFISIATSSWATTALLLTLPDEPSESN